MRKLPIVVLAALALPVQAATPEPAYSPASEPWRHENCEAGPPGFSRPTAIMPK